MSARTIPPTGLTGAKGWHQSWRVTGLCLALAVMTLAVFAQTGAHAFVNCDDDDYVYDNAIVAQGLTARGIAWAFTTSHAFNWHPLTWLSHELDCQIYGLHPGGHHLTNVALHTATVIVLFLVLLRMTGAMWRSAFVAAVFAIHPLRVESVAWVAERKDVLSGLFFVLTIGAYIRYAQLLNISRPGQWRRYALVALLFALGLMCKPMLVTLPLVLLLLDFWPLRRPEPVKQLVLEKLPLFALSAVSCLLTMWAQTALIQSTAATAAARSIPLRLANMAVTGMVYLRQMVWPANLAIFYPFPRDGFEVWQVALAVVLLAGLTALALWRRRQQPWLAAGWFWYLVMLLPVIGIVQVGLQAHADRYTYLPQIGLYVAVTWLVAEWLKNRAVLGGLMAVVLVVLMVCAWKQTTYWADAETLWRRALACTPENEVSHYNLGLVLQHQGKLAEAITEFQSSLKCKPDNALALNQIGSALLQAGKLDEAIPVLEQTLQLNPNLPGTQNNLGYALAKEGKFDEAVAHYQIAVQTNPDSAISQINLADALLTLGRGAEAIPHYQVAAPLVPKSEAVHFNLANALAQAGRMDEAIPQYEQALTINPNNAIAYNNLGGALLQLGRVDEAGTCFEKALALNPGLTRARDILTRLQQQKQTVNNASAH